MIDEVLKHDDIIICLYCKYQMYLMDITPEEAKELSIRIEKEDSTLSLNERLRIALRCIIQNNIESENEENEKQRLKDKYGDSVYTTDDLRKDFKVFSFLAPFTQVEYKGQKGLVMFQHSPRFYFDFKSIDNILEEILNKTNQVFNLCLPEEEIVLVTSMLFNKF